MQQLMASTSDNVVQLPDERPKTPEQEGQRYEPRSVITPEISEADSINEDDDMKDIYGPTKTSRMTSQRALTPDLTEEVSEPSDQPVSPPVGREEKEGEAEIRDMA